MINGIVDTASYNSAAQDVGQIFAASFVPVFGDVTATGTLKIQCSNDAPVGGTLRQTFVPTNWADVPGATSAVVSGVGPAILLAQVSYSYIRIVYTRTSGGSTTFSVAANFSGM